MCREVARQLGVARFHLHQLRHTLGTLLQETVGDARLTADTLGHVGLSSVSGYTKISAERRRLAQAGVEQRGL